MEDRGAGRQRSEALQHKSAAEGVAWVRVQDTEPLPGDWLGAAGRHRREQEESAAGELEGLGQLLELLREASWRLDGRARERVLARAWRLRAAELLGGAIWTELAGLIGGRSSSSRGSDASPAELLGELELDQPPRQQVAVPAASTGGSGQRAGQPEPVSEHAR